ncbi:hypothetical protein PoB_000729400 [Plakobranchus ocellatus]|uniref:Uncharacterized protein n=1 Tax=Plakobranchus ocellatus TaxID=259542 RepID=A0AAV3YCN5_9GAST|nr:hypothetical protein PoB_000729400 [Plakobranchus ocellatus]
MVTLINEKRKDDDREVLLSRPQTMSKATKKLLMRDCHVVMTDADRNVAEVALNEQQKHPIIEEEASSFTVS